ncbi:CDP-glycerol glycerophosphotransferase family protein [bacterium]|nr:CDP-glycerol glycerophosphotransferase family protein [bacterium]
MSDAPRILFYIKRNLHLPHVEPILRWMETHTPEVQVRVSAPPWIAPTEGLPGTGLTAAEIDAVKAKGLQWLPYGEIADWSPDATIMADADYAGLHWPGKLVNVNHGLISKGWYYTNKPGVQRENQGDLICVPGPYHAEVLTPMLSKPVVATGLVKFDPVGRGELTQQTARTMFGLPLAAEVVLLAPTFNMELSAVPVLADRARELVHAAAGRGDRHLLIKLHGMAPPVWQEMYRLLAALEQRIHYVDSADLTPSLMAADVVISDVSSAYMEAIALDRPVVLVDNPLQTRYFNYDPNDIEYRWRDVGVRAKTVDEALAAVDHCFANPEEKVDARRTYGRKLVGDIDGRASERAALAILTLLEREELVTKAVANS